MTVVRGDRPTLLAMLICYDQSLIREVYQSVSRHGGEPSGRRRPQTYIHTPPPQKRLGAQSSGNYIHTYNMYEKKLSIINSHKC